MSYVVMAGLKWDFFDGLLAQKWNGPIGFVLVWTLHHRLKLLRMTLPIRFIYLLFSRSFQPTLTSGHGATTQPGVHFDITAAM